MFDYIHHPKVQPDTRYSQTDYKRIKSLFDDQLFKIQEHHRSQNILVEAWHPLLLIMQQCQTSFKRNIEDYVEVVNERVATTAQRLNFYHLLNTSPSPQRGLFYHSGVTEYIFLDESLFDPELCYRYWEAATPIRVYSHPFTDLNMDIPNGHYNSEEQGCAVIGINVAMLLVQFNGWRDDPKNKDKSPRNFIYEYPILNMLKRHLDICVINRTMALYQDMPVADYQRQHEIMTVNFVKLVDDSLLGLITKIKRMKLRYQELFTIFHPIYKETWFDIIELKDIPPLRSVRWLLLVNYIRYLYYYIECCKANNMIEERQVITDIKRDILTMTKDKNISTLDNRTRLMFDTVSSYVNNY